MVIPRAGLGPALWAAADDGLHAGPLGRALCSQTLLPDKASLALGQLTAGTNVPLAALASSLLCPHTCPPGFSPHHQQDDFLPPVCQDIIPQPPLRRFVSMTNPARAQAGDTDMAKCCAYSLPGVALGRRTSTARRTHVRGWLQTFR